MQPKSSDLLKYLQNHCLPEEKEAIEDWLEADQKHRDSLSGLRLIWQNANTDSAYKPNVQKGWQRVEEKTLESGSDTIDAGNYQRIWRIAAMLLLMAGLGIAYFLYNDQSNTLVPTLVEYRAVDKVQELLLPDGSKVWLDQSATITYEKSFTERHVEIAGTAYFEVKRDEKAPFQVTSKLASVTVLGTRFSFDEEAGSVRIAVQEGKVGVSYSGMKSSPVEITTNQVARLTEGSSLIEVSEAGNMNTLAWKDGALRFDDTPFEMVLADLGDYYEVIFDLKENRAATCLVSARFDHKSLEEVITVLEAILDVRFDESDTSNYIVSGKGC